MLKQFPQSIDISSLNSTRQLAFELAQRVKLGDIIFLQGDLGTGKTTFVQFFLEYISGVTEVTSPTFNLIHSYPASGFDVHHLDLYRFEQPEEVEELAIDELVDNSICLIEWPERAIELLPKPNYVLSFQLTGEDRKVTITT